MRSRGRSTFYFFLAFWALITALHLPYLRLPFFWDELGHFVPAALDLLQHGQWIPSSTPPNAHPPALSAILAALWSVTGVSIPATRLLMLAIASVGALLAFLLAIRLGRGTAGAPAFAAVLFLLATPLFFTQAMMAQLDMPAMVLTTLALLLFLGDRYGWCAVACTAAVLIKETTIVVPLVFAVWLLWKPRQPSDHQKATFFAVPPLVLAAWFAILYRFTGSPFGDPGFTESNLIEALQPAHLALAVLSRAYYLFVADGRWLGALALFLGWRLLRTRDWAIAASVAIAQLLVVTVLGGATLERYLLPVLPILYAGMAVAASMYPGNWRFASHAILIGALFLGWFWAPIFPQPYENNLAMADAVALDQQAAEFLTAYRRNARVATTWPLSDALARPEYGYVYRPFPVEAALGDDLPHLAGLSRDADLLILHGHAGLLDAWDPPLIVRRTLQSILESATDFQPPATAAQIRAGLGYVPVVRFSRGSWLGRAQWIDIFVRE